MKFIKVTKSKNYTLYKDKITNTFLIKAKKYYLGMLFMRYQEFYESKKFRDKYFTIIEFIDYYTKLGIFSYTSDWVGYNIPSYIILNLQCNISDWNHYDEDMMKIIKQIRKITNKEFYLIGTASDKNKDEILNHEFAHALYYLNDNYKKEQLDNIKNLTFKEQRKIKKWLLKKGYHKSVIKDEIQAYMIDSDNIKHFKIEKNHKAFKTTFDKYNI